MKHLDISVRPDFTGLPPNVVHGLIQLGDNAAALLTLVSGIGIAVSLIGLVIGSWTSNHQITERSRSGLIVSAGALAILYIAVAAANYSARLFA